MITKEKLQAMSDFEVNKTLHLGLLTKKPMKDLESIKLVSSSFQVRYKSGCNFLSHIKDYCNTPNDIMPLQIEHRLSLDCVNHQTDGYWIAGANTFYHVADTNPLRAIACCLILVLQEQKR